MTRSKYISCAVLIAGILLSFAPRAHAAGVTDIQMLPPLNFDYKTVCGGSSGSPLILAWDGINPINCIPGITGNSSGLLTAPSITTSDLQFLSGGAKIDVTSTVVNLTRLGNCPSPSLQAITRQPDGTFACIAVTDIVGVGKTVMPTCTAGDQIYFNGSGFTCSPIPFPVVAVPPFPVPCTGANVLQFNGSTYQCVPISSLVAAPPPAAAPPGGCYDNYHALRSADGVNFVCSPTACYYDGNYNAYFPGVIAATLPANLTTPQWVPLDLSLWHYRSDGGHEGITCVDPINNVFTAFSNGPGASGSGME